jgi:hypothetical protein
MESFVQQRASSRLAGESDERLCWCCVGWHSVGAKSRLEAWTLRLVPPPARNQAALDRKQEHAKQSIYNKSTATILDSHINFCHLHPDYGAARTTVSWTGEIPAELSWWSASPGVRQLGSAHEVGASP